MAQKYVRVIFTVGVRNGIRLSVKLHRGLAEVPFGLQR